MAPRDQCSWTRERLFLRNQAPAGTTAGYLIVEEDFTTVEPLHTAVPGLFAHHHQGIYIDRRFDEP